MPDDPLEYKAEADAALDRLAQRLRRLLQEAAGQLDPFPPFPDIVDSQTIKNTITLNSVF